MNREEYLNQLKKNLININDAEKEDAVRFYTEYFDDAGVENEQKVIEELGSPVILARKISAEAAIKEIDCIKEEKKTVDGSPVVILKEKGDGIWKNLFTILLLLCSFPVWLPISIVLIVFVFVVVLLAVIAVGVVAIIGVAFVIAGVVGIVGGIIGLFAHFIHGITSIGVGLLIVGAGILLFVAGKYLFGGITMLIVTLGKRKASRM